MAAFICRGQKCAVSSYIDPKPAVQTADYILQFIIHPENNQYNKN